MKLPALAFVLAVLSAPTLAQSDARAADRAAATKAPFVFETGVVDLRTLLERCGTYLQRNILADDVELGVGPGKPKGKPAAEASGGPFVELQLPVVTDAAGCEELLTGLLWTRGLVLVPLDEAKGVYEVLSMNGARAREINLRAPQRTVQQVLARPTLRQFVTVVVELRHTNATIANNALRPFFAMGGSNNGMPLNVGNVGNSTSLLLSGPQDVVAIALQLVQAADVPQPPESRPDLQQRLEALARQNEQLAQRVATLEEKLGKPK
ncbi:MAG: hypothetical protein JNK15_03710 [Planctomycetes bacterium]|nr:hypothetical protein [Planctomycetota bacterium]